MRIAEDWSDLLFDLNCLSKQTAKRKFKRQIKYGWGGLCAYCRGNRATTLDHLPVGLRCSALEVGGQASVPPCLTDQRFGEYLSASFESQATGFL